MMKNTAYSLLISIVCGTLQVFGSVHHCPTGQYSWQYKDNCFEVIFSEKNWYRAREHCANRGGDLAEVRSPDIQDSIVTHLQGYNNGYHGYWIGATDSDREGKWLWMHDSRTMTYSNWHPDQGPNRHGFFFGDIQDCAMIRSDDHFRWHDGPCNAGPAFHYSFICQYEINHIQRLPNHQTPTTHTAPVTNTRTSESIPLVTSRNTSSTLKITEPFMMNSPQTTTSVPKHQTMVYQTVNPFISKIINSYLTSRITASSTRKFSTKSMEKTTASSLPRISTNPKQQKQQPSRPTKDYGVLLIG